MGGSRKPERLELAQTEASWGPVEETSGTDPDAAIVTDEEVLQITAEMVKDSKPSGDGPEGPGTSSMQKRASDSKEVKEVVRLADQAESLGPVHPENTRRELALALVKILAGTIAASFLLMLAAMGVGFWYGDGGKPTAVWAVVRDWLEVVFPTLATLVATVLGYYFGSQSKQ